MNMKRLIVFCLSVYASASAVENWDGEHYQATSRPQFEMAEWAFNTLPKKKYEAILDIGCGSGEFTKELAKHASYVLGVDYSESMILKAQDLYGNSDDLSFQVGDIRELNGIDQQFDLVTAFHPIQWIPAADQPRAFTRMADMLVPGGVCLVLVSDQQNIFYAPLMDVVQRPRWQSFIPDKLEPWNWQTVASVRKSFKQAGLRPLSISVWYKKYYFASRDEFLAFMKNWFFNAAHFEYVPRQKRYELFREVLEEFLTRINYNGIGAVVFECPFVIGVAAKLG
jgi:trans-aconitate methyltransferase